MVPSPSHACWPDGVEIDPDMMNDLEVNMQENLKEKAIARLIMIAILVGLSGSISRAADLARSGPRLSASRQADQQAALAGDVLKAKSELQSGVNAWSLEILSSARDHFINLLMANPGKNALLHYYVALADYRLSSCCLSSGDITQLDRYVTEGRQYSEKAIKIDPEFGESYALAAFLIGLEIASHPERAMSLGAQSFEYFALALDKEPENPRVQLLKGVYQLYVPEAYGGGPASALDFLIKSVDLFEKETVRDALGPTWGKEEACTYLGRAYGLKKEFAKARLWLNKALEVNPDFGLAKAELKSLEKSERSS